MNPLRTLIEAGLTLRTDGERLIVTPAIAITGSLRKLIVAYKPMLHLAVRNAEDQADALVASINRCCDARGDDGDNRAALIAESAGYAPHEMADLIEHFDGEANRLTIQPAVRTGAHLSPNE